MFAENEHNEHTHTLQTKKKMVDLWFGILGVMFCSVALQRIGRQRQSKGEKKTHFHFTMQQNKNNERTEQKKKKNNFMVELNATMEYGT